MGSHDCRLSVQLNLKAAVTEADVRNALAAFLETHEIDYDEPGEDDMLEFSNGQLSLELNVYGWGGANDDAVKQVAEMLGQLVDGYDHILWYDFDTGDTEEACVPYFVGPDQAAKDQAAVAYGFAQLEAYATGRVDTALLKSVKQQLLDDVVGANVSHCGLDASSHTARAVRPGKDAASLFMAELLDSVESLTELAESKGVRTLADLMYLEQAILKGGFIDHYPTESSVLEVVRALPSGKDWLGFIEVAAD